VADVEEQKSLDETGGQAEPDGDDQYVFKRSIVLGSTVESLMHKEKRIEGSKERVQLGTCNCGWKPQPVWRKHITSGIEGPVAKRRPQRA